MAKLVALYKNPQDPAAFDRHYFSVHVPLAKTMPGLRTYEVSSGAISSNTGESSYHLVGILTFDSLAAIQLALSSPQGQAAADDLAIFAKAGVELLMFDFKEI